MTANDELQLALPEGDSVDALREQLGQRYSLSEEPEQNQARSYYDSFDWRLYLSGGLLLLAESAEEGLRLLWQDWASGRLIDSLVVERPPRLVEDLPEGGFRERLAPILEMRALLPVVKLESRVQILRLLDTQEKTILRVVLDSHRYSSPDGQVTGSLRSRVRLLPVRGYAKPLQLMQRFLQQDLALQPLSEPLLTEALQALGCQPGDYSSKLDFRLDPLMRSDAVAKQIQLQLLHTLEANLEGTIQDLDSEFLHDLRVATRRARSALTQIKEVFPAAEVERFKERLAWIGSITGPTRDMDVYLMGFEAYRDSLPESVRGDLAPLQAFLVAHHQSDQSALAGRLESDELRSLLTQWRAFLEAPVPEPPQAPNALRPIAELASERIYKMYKRVLREGLAIDRDSPAEDYHELRKSCKKLRYLMEFFQSLYAAKPIRRLVKELKVLLDNLGNFQDLEVQADKLRGFGGQMLKEGNAPAETLLAMGMLVDGLLRRQQQTRQAFAKRFDAFADPDNRRSFKHLFSHRQQPL